jgi:basic membrane protein A and related proteins
MYKNLAATWLVSAVAACFTTTALCQTLVQQTPKIRATTQQLKVGFVYVAPLTEAGWVRQHEEGRKAVDAALGSQVKTTYVENVAEGADAERVIRELASQGHKLIFTPALAIWSLR